ncbi:MAG: hypothetical protein IPN29_22015 [Saprospiraceae bacterium]|nr:hypothetical protein [Saprospiraceae bacterium]
MQFLISPLHIFPLVIAITGKSPIIPLFANLQTIIWSFIPLIGNRRHKSLLHLLKSRTKYYQISNGFADLKSRRTLALGHTFRRSKADKTILDENLSRISASLSFPRS